MADAKLTALTETSVAALDDVGYTVDISDTTDDAAGSSRKISFNRLGGLFIPSYCDGRLTTESGVPVSTSDRTSQGTIYFTPYLGNRITIYDGTRWKLYSFTERSLALTATVDKNYDVFIYDNSGTLTLELSAAWTNDTTRADALTTQDGVYVKSGATTRRWIGTIRASASNATEDSAAKRFVWSYHNRVDKSLRVTETADSWTYTSATYRSANNSTANRVQLVVGATDVLADLYVECIYLAPATLAYANVAIGEDSTSSEMSGKNGGQSNGATSVVFAAKAGYLRPVPLGFHYYQWLEATDPANTITFFGSNSGARLYNGGILGRTSC